MSESESPFDLAAAADVTEMSAPGLRRGTRERTLTIRHQAPEDTTKSSSTLKRKRPAIVHTDTDETSDISAKLPKQSEAPQPSGSTTRKRVTTKQTIKSNISHAKPSTKTRLGDSLSKITSILVDLTKDDDDDNVSISSKKQKRSKAKQGEEKRLKRHRTQAPQKYATVAHRATTQRMVVIDRRRPNNDDCPHRHPTCPMEEIDLAGSTGNIYTVRIHHVPDCTCPDFRMNGNPQCKHILYCLLKVLKAPEPLNYQAAFLTSELEEIFEQAGPLPTETVNIEDKDGMRKPVEGDCPICCEELSSEAETIVWCQAACGNNLHKSCFDQWAATKGPAQVTCPYCRTQWQNEVDGSVLKGLAKSGPRNRDGYVNVADQVGMSTRRDYSTYHEYWVHRQRRHGLIDDDYYDYAEHDY